MADERRRESFLDGRDPGQMTDAYRKRKGARWHTDQLEGQIHGTVSCAGSGRERPSSPAKPVPWQGP